jgi:hypothetical protein
VLGCISGSKREEVAGDWRRQHNEELHNFHVSPKIVRVIKSRRVRLPVHEARDGGMRNAYEFLSENLKGIDHLEDLGVDDKIISEWILGKCGGRVLTAFIWLTTETNSGLL